MKIMKLHLLSILFCFLIFDSYFNSKNNEIAKLYLLLSFFINYFNNVIKKISTSLIYNGTGKKTLVVN